MPTVCISHTFLDLVTKTEVTSTANETPVKVDKSPTKKLPKRKRILSSDSEDEGNVVGMKTEYEKEDPDYQPGSGAEKQKPLKKVPKCSSNIVLSDQNKDQLKHNSVSVEAEVTQSPVPQSPNKKAIEQSTNKTTEANFDSPKKDKHKDKEKHTKRVDVKNHNSKSEKHKSSNHKGSSGHHSHSSNGHREKDVYYRNKDKHRTSPHKKHSSILLGPANIKKESELSFKLASMPTQTTTTNGAIISLPSSTKDSSSTEAIKIMLSGEKTNNPNFHQKSQQSSFHVSGNRARNISHERENASKLFPRIRPSVLNNHSSSATDEATKKTSQNSQSSGLVKKDSKMDNARGGMPIGRPLSNSNAEQEKLVVAKMSNKDKISKLDSIECHNLLGTIMTEMKKN